MCNWCKATSCYSGPRLVTACTAMLASSDSLDEITTLATSLPPSCQVQKPYPYSCEPNQLARYYLSDTRTHSLVYTWPVQLLRRT